MKLPVCPFDITYCTNTDCQNTDCGRHPKVFVSLKDRFAMEGRTVSVADFSGVCRDYIRRLVEEED